MIKTSPIPQPVKKLCAGASVIAVAAALSGAASARDAAPYVSISGALVEKSSSSNEGALNSTFTTGAGTTIPAGTDLAAGTSLGWDTEFKTGFSGAAAYGFSYDSGLRGELELRYLETKISGHSDLTVGGGAIGTEDAGVLVTGSDNLGVSVANLIADGQGKGKTWALMANAYYDFAPDSSFNPYIGVGVGYADTDYTFTPSGVGVADDGGSGFAYQGILGADLYRSGNMKVFADYRYFVTEDVSTDLSLLPGTLDVENQNHIFSVGIKFGF